MRAVSSVGGGGRASVGSPQRGLPLFRVAIAAARNEVTVGIAPRLGLRDDMVDSPYEDGKAEGGAGVRQRGNISKF
jgi:hypothetical protein